MKEFNKQYHLYTKIKVSLKNSLIALLDQAYPGVNDLFDSPVRGDGRQKWVDFADTFWHADCVSTLSEKAFTERYRKWCKRRGYNFSASKASNIYIESLGNIITLPKNANTKLLIREAITQLNAVSRSVEIFRTEIQRLAEMLPEYPIVMAMYGLHEKNPVFTKRT